LSVQANREKSGQHEQDAQVGEYHVCTNIRDHAGSKSQNDPGNRVCQWSVSRELMAFGRSAQNRLANRSPPGSEQTWAQKPHIVSSLNPKS
jgi:hypothetical protein